MSTHSRAEREQRERDASVEESLAAAERALREATLEQSRNESRAEDGTHCVHRGPAPRAMSTCVCVCVLESCLDDRFDPARQGFNQGHPALGPRCLDDAVQKTVEACQDVPWYEVAADRRQKDFRRGCQVDDDD